MASKSEIINTAEKKISFHTTSKLVKILSAAFLVIIFNQCANQLPPGGGEIDKLPPGIVEVIPLNKTMNYNSDFFEITFSEYVDKRSVQEAIFISPPLARGLEYDWSGKTLTAFFKDTLKVNTTYTITIGAEVEDINNRNKMIEPFTFAFSTGVIIDTGKISGKIFNDEPSGTMVYAYLTKDKEVDPTTEKPAYVSQVGKNGKYQLLGLNKGEYQVYAIRDRFRDFLYQRNEDDFGIQFKKLLISDETNEITNCDFFLSIEDTIPPKLSSVVMKDKNHFLIEFNEPIDSSKIFSSNFFIYDSTTSRKILLSSFYKGEARDKQFNISFNDSLVQDNRNFLISENIIDLFGNINKYESTSITPRYERDTIPPKLIKISGLMPEDKVDFESPMLMVKINDGFIKDSLSNFIVIEDSKQKIYPHEINFIDDASFLVKINEKLKQRSEYNIKLDLRKIIDIAGNKVDSTYKQKFITNSELDFSGVSGSIQFANADSSVYVRIESIGNVKKLYQQKVNKDKTFVISKVIPDKYILSSYVDEDSNKRYSHGSVKPFRLSEKFLVYPDTLNLRARWPVGDIFLKY